ncbi:MAG: NAD(P)-binding domain-containing protein [Rhodospirillales bacterium]|nr:MAG: NAD(P)-binding domain-containing protein [Rhodospirillales bacterium]
MVVADTTLPVAVIGAGPVGLAMAAHLVARGQRVVVLEASDGVAAHIGDFAHVRLFSPWRYNVDAAARALLERRGWTMPDPEALPTGGDLRDRYLAPLAATPEIAAALRLGHRVVSVSRHAIDKVKTAGRDAAPFTLRVARADGAGIDIQARAVVDASGTWSHPNPMGAGGVPALGETAAADRVRYGIPDVLGRERARYAGRRVLVVGAGHSAANALLDLAALAREAPGTEIVWAVRAEGDLARLYGGGDADALAARGALGTGLRALVESGAVTLRTGFRVAELRRASNRVDVVGADGVVIPGVDEIVVATGQRPDLEITRELRLRLDPALECVEALGPLIDPNIHSCGTVRPHGARQLAHPETGFFTVGVKSYGRAPTFLLATGYEQARSVAAALAGDWIAADRVELDLPATGVCSSTPATGATRPAVGTPVATGCCGPSAPAIAPMSERVAAAGACCGPAAASIKPAAAPALAIAGSGCGGKARG